jgi:hypothetical protein
MYSVRSLARLWQVSPRQIRNLFRDREGIVNIALSQERQAWRIPASLAIEVATERGYLQPDGTRV